MIRIALILIALLPIVTGSGAKWSYEEPKRWLRFRGNRYCGGLLQSPIDIRQNESHYDIQLRRLFFETRNNSNEYSLVNNGHTAKLSMSGSYKLKNVLPMSEDFHVEQLHFHWGGGENNTVGSEHLLEGESFPLEMHIVTYSSLYNSIGEAMTNIHGLAVVGFFFQITENSNPALEAIVDALPRIHQAKEQTLLTKEFDLKNLIGEERTRYYYRYDGSLTTPPCYESVIWSVVLKPLDISREQLQAFFDLREENQKLMKHNNRPVQPIGARKLRRSFYEKNEPYFVESKNANQNSSGSGLVVDIHRFMFIFIAFRVFF